MNFFKKIQTGSQNKYKKLIIKKKLLALRIKIQSNIEIKKYLIINLIRTKIIKLIKYLKKNNCII